MTDRKPSFADKARAVLGSADEAERQRAEQLRAKHAMQEEAKETWKHLRGTLPSQIDKINAEFEDTGFNVSLREVPQSSGPVLGEYEIFLNRPGQTATFQKLKIAAYDSGKISCRATILRGQAGDSHDLSALHTSSEELDIIIRTFVEKALEA